MSGHHGIDSYERYRLSRAGFDGDALVEGPEIGRETSALDDCTPGLWDVLLYLGAFVLSVAIGAACILAAIGAGHQ